jgi:DNA polymerase-3 subunit gamma/tau
MRASAGGAAMAIVPRTAAPEPMPERAVAPTAAVAAVPADFREMVALFGANRESILRAHLANNVHLVRYEPGRLEFHATPAAPTDLANRVSRLLAEWTGRPWAVALSREEGQPTLAQQDQAAERNQFDEARRHPLVQAALEAFPGATIESVRTLVADAPTSDLGPSPDPDAPEGDDA